MLYQPFGTWFVPFRDKILWSIILPLCLADKASWSVPLLAGTCQVFHYLVYDGNTNVRYFGQLTVFCLIIVPHRCGVYAFTRRYQIFILDYFNLNTRTLYLTCRNPGKRSGWGWVTHYFGSVREWLVLCLASLVRQVYTSCTLYMFLTGAVLE